MIDSVRFSATSEDDRQGIRPMLALVSFVLVLALFCLLDMFEFANLALMFIAYQGLLLFLPVAVVGVSRVSVRRGLGLALPPLADSVWLILSSIVFVLLYFHLIAVLAGVFPGLRDLAISESAWMHHALSGMPLPLLLAGAMLVAIAEEVFFRGFLLRALLRRFGPMITIIASAACFALVHLSLAKALPTLVAGLWLGYVVVRTGSIWVAVAAHFLLNATAFVGVMVVGWPDGVLRFLAAPPHHSAIGGTLVWVGLVLAYEVRRAHSARPIP